MLFGTVLPWALNVTATRYLLTHGFGPLAYGSIRYFAAASLFWGLTAQRERSFRIRLSDAKLVVLCGLLPFVNQLFFVSSLHLTTASTLGLVLGATPVFVGLFALLVLNGDLLGDLLAVGTAASWAGYSVSIAPLMRRYSPFRISALVLALGWLPLALASIPELAEQLFDHFRTLTWVAFAYAVVGPLFLTNILWFTAIDRVGPSSAALFVNLQPSFTVLFALLLLSAHLNRWEIAGGVAIAVGIALERFWHREQQPVLVE